MRALLIVDVQYDFLDGGALAVPGGTIALSAIRALMGSYEHVLGTLDWHPRDHASFIEFAARTSDEAVATAHIAKWPVHCVAFTHGAMPAISLGERPSALSRYFPKGRRRLTETFSFLREPVEPGETAPLDWLRVADVDQIDIVGMALEYCVKATAIDLAASGIKTRVLLEATASLHEDRGKTCDQLAHASVILID